MVRVSDKAIKDARVSFTVDNAYMGPSADTEIAGTGTHVGIVDSEGDP